MTFDLRDHLTEAHDSLIALSADFYASDDPVVVGMGEGLALGAVEIRRILSLGVADVARHEGPPPWGRTVDVREVGDRYDVELLGWRQTCIASYKTRAEAENHAAAVLPRLSNQRTGA